MKLLAGLIKGKAKPIKQAKPTKKPRKYKKIGGLTNEQPISYSEKFLIIIINNLIDIMNGLTYLIEIYKDFVINNRTPKGIRKGNSFIMVKDLLTLTKGLTIKFTEKIEEVFHFINISLVIEIDKKSSNNFLIEHYKRVEALNKKREGFESIYGSLTITDEVKYDKIGLITYFTDLYNILKVFFIYIQGAIKLKDFYKKNMEVIDPDKEVLFEYSKVIEHAKNCEEWDNGNALYKILAFIKEEQELRKQKRIEAVKPASPKASLNTYSS